MWHITLKKIMKYHLKFPLNENNKKLYFKNDVDYTINLHQSNERQKARMIKYITEEA